MPVHLQVKVTNTAYQRHKNKQLHHCCTHDDNMQNHLVLKQSCSVLTAPQTKRQCKAKPRTSTQFFTLLTWKCASRHNCVHFFNLSTSKSALNVVCFVHFDFAMCFGPQGRTLFPHQNFQTWSEPVRF